ncbi:hypothetical protein BWK59_01350 [Flavobacterium davisii]|uniref:Glycosyl transferase family 1 domain-containing protein n=1 Tax=Flavobacterium davisii TaxID=2906077 RepID=A0A2D0AIZ0_9FLAO|nr:glycosyltransferase [Flavobacterium davisii]OWP85216.1 hypothetical protein BWK59_01350 [Flavobacterium davisii]
MKKKIFFFGYFEDIGGKEIEVNLLVRFFEEKYLCTIFSLSFMSKKSVALDKLVNLNFTNIYIQILNDYLIIKILAFFSRFYNNFKKSLPYYVENTISKRVYNFDEIKIKLLKREILKVDYIFYCGTLDNKSLCEIIEFSNKHHKKMFIRITGQIHSIGNFINTGILKKANIILHSFSNASILMEYGLKKIIIIDQTTFCEQELLEIPIIEKENLTFGFLGRFSPEKGLMELLSFSKEANIKLLIGGCGPLKSQMLDLLNENIEYIGEFKKNFIHDFFRKIDVLVIPSIEESGPLVAIEAIAAGKLILSTDVGAMKERLRKSQNQFWFSIDNFRSFKETLESLMTLSKLQIVSIQRSNRQLYIENHSFSKLKESYLRLLD